MHRATIETLYASAYAHYQNGNGREAVPLFEALCLQSSFESRFWVGLAASLQISGLYKEALSAWGMVALLKETDPAPHFHAAECAFSLGDVEDGSIALLRAIELLDGKDHPLKGRMEVLQKQWNL